MYKKILVPVDGSPTAKRGLEEAIELSKSHGSQLRLLHVIDEVMVTGMDPQPAIYMGALLDALKASGKAIMKTAEGLVREQGLVPECVVLETLGRAAADVILEQAQQWPADLIVMGTHGRRGLRRLALGSDAEMVLRGAAVPVLLVKA